MFSLSSVFPLLTLKDRILFHYPHECNACGHFVRKAETEGVTAEEIVAHLVQFTVVGQ